MATGVVHFQCYSLHHVVLIRCNSLRIILSGAICEGRSCFPRARRPYTTRSSTGAPPKHSLVIITPPNHNRPKTRHPARTPRLLSMLATLRCGSFLFLYCRRYLGVREYLGPFLSVSRRISLPILPQVSRRARVHDADGRTPLLGHVRPNFHI